MEKSLYCLSPADYGHTDGGIMNIRTSTMAVGIRGTCEWMEAPDPNHMRVYILDGKVECRIPDEESGEEETAPVSAGETAVMNVSEGQMSITATFRLCI